MSNEIILLVSLMAGLQEATRDGQYWPYGSLVTSCTKLRRIWTAHHQKFLRPPPLLLIDQVKYISTAGLAYVQIL